MVCEMICDIESAIFQRFVIRRLPVPPSCYVRKREMHRLERLLATVLGYPLLISHENKMHAAASLVRVSNKAPNANSKILSRSAENQCMILLLFLLSVQRHVLLNACSGVWTNQSQSMGCRKLTSWSSKSLLVVVGNDRGLSGEFFALNLALGLLSG